MMITAQLSLYPLRTERLTPILNRFWEGMPGSVSVEVGRMSTTLAGEDEEVFRAVKEAFQRAAVEADIVLHCTFSNACPPLKETHSS